MGELLPANQLEVKADSHARSLQVSFGIFQRFAKNLRNLRFLEICTVHFVKNGYALTLDFVRGGVLYMCLEFNAITCNLNFNAFTCNLKFALTIKNLHKICNGFGERKLQFHNF